MTPRWGKQGRQGKQARPRGPRERNPGPARTAPANGAGPANGARPRANGARALRSGSGRRGVGLLDHAAPVRAVHLGGVAAVAVAVDGVLVAGGAGADEPRTA